MTRSERSIREEAQARISSLVKAYQSAGDEIKATLTQAALTEAGQARAQSHLQQIDAIITALNAEAVDSAHSLTAFGFGQGKDLSVEALRRHGITLPREFGTGINTSAVQSVADQMAQDLLEANGTLGANARRILRKTKQNVLSEADINDKVSQGLMEGSTRNQMVSRLRDAFVKELDGAALIEVGDGEKLRHYEPGYYAKMVAHTRHREAVTEGIMNTAHEADVTLFRWSIHEGACPLCQQYQGKVYSSGGESKFPPLTEKPPLHPFCEHVLTAFVEDYYDAGELKRYEQMSNDAGYVHSTSDWNRAMNGDGTLHSEPWLPEGSGSGKGKAGESTAKSAENAKKSESQRAQRGAEDRPKSKKPSTTETPGQPNSVPESPGQANKHDANRLSSLANDTRAIVDPKATGYTTYQDGKQFLRFPHPGIKSEADFNAMLAKPIIFPEDISVDMVQVLNKTLSELVGDSHRLATPPIRGLQFSERKALASMGDGVLGLNPTSLLVEFERDFTVSESAIADNGYEFFVNKGALENVIHHEFGHHIHQQRGVKGLGNIQKPPMEVLLKDMFERSGMGKGSKTMRATRNYREWFAENYALARMGRWDLVDDFIELVVLLKEVIQT